MMADSVQDSPDFMAGLKGRLLVNESMSRHTSWRTGGIADYFYTPADKADLIMLLRKLPQQIPVYWVGLGSNLLVRDGGFQGMIIRTSKGLDAIAVKSSNRLYVESGVSCAKVARTAARNNLTGVEFLAGVPGSFGGALAMNAGAFGGETWEWVESIECVDRKGQCSELASSNVKFGYRNVNLPENNWILGGVLALEMAAGDYDGKDKIRSLLDQRGATQPIQSANAGSVFKNPPGDFAARLIEEAGLKGREIGDAAISSIHANFIVNKGNATSGDIERLIQMSRERVRQHCGIELDLEVRVIGSAE
jgi:UDP-N-acetylmuramate dehydrogenase